MNGLPGSRGEGLILRGGIWKQKEHIFLWNQIGELIMEQNPVGKFLGTGTIIPLGRRGGCCKGRDGRGREGKGHSQRSKDPYLG
jgi:hypothetical protein